MPDKPKNRLSAVNLDGTIGPGPSPDAEHERKVAIYDLIEENAFEVIGHDHGPYHLTLSTEHGRILFDIAGAHQARVTLIGLSLSPFRRIVKDYHTICDSYFQAIRTATPSQIETIDMARRGLHDEGSTLLRERLKGKVEVDHDTARRLFTLLAVLSWRG